jgi:hypothetical protein
MDNKFNADISFWTGFYNDEDCFSWASNKAYLDMNRTMTFKETPKNDSQKEKNRIDALRKPWRDAGTKAIKDGFKSVPTDFTVWHKSICEKLIEIYGTDKLVEKENNKRTEQPAKLTYGQAQKWLNMTLKYLWLLDRLEHIDDVNISSFIRTHAKSFHVPLDSYILRYVAKQDKSKNDKFDSSNNNELEADFDDYWKSFRSAWSHIDKVDEYYEYQKKLAEAVANTSPLEWELIHWHKALKYYG